jgi:hypothetical protein
MATWAPLERLSAKSASFPKATHRCHSVRDSQDPASFFQDVLVASEKIAMLVELVSDWVALSHPASLSFSDGVHHLYSEWVGT